MCKRSCVAGGYPGKCYTGSTNIITCITASISLHGVYGNVRFFIISSFLHHTIPTISRQGSIFSRVIARKWRGLQLPINRYGRRFPSGCRRSVYYPRGRKSAGGGSGCRGGGKGITAPAEGHTGASRFHPRSSSEDSDSESSEASCACCTCADERWLHLRHLAAGHTTPPPRSESRPFQVPTSIGPEPAAEQPHDKGKMKEALFAVEAHERPRTTKERVEVLCRMEDGFTHQT